MALRYLVDTNILSNPRKPQPNLKVLQMLEQHEAQIATASIVWYEMWHGCLRLPPSKKRSLIEQYLENLSDLPILPYTAEAARWHAAEVARLQSTGRLLPFRDSLIAAVAHAHGLVLVTDNITDFAHFDGLTIENWMR